VISRHPLDVGIAVHGSGRLDIAARAGENLLRSADRRGVRSTGCPWEHRGTQPVKDAGAEPARLTMNWLIDHELRFQTIFIRVETFHSPVTPAW